MSSKYSLIKFNNKFFKTKKAICVINEAKYFISHLMGSSTPDILEDML